MNAIAMRIENRCETRNKKQNRRRIKLTDYYSMNELVVHFSNGYVHVSVKIAIRYCTLCILYTAFSVIVGVCDGRQLYIYFFTSPCSEPSSRSLLTIHTCTINESDESARKLHRATEKRYETKKKKKTNLNICISMKR